MILKQEPQDLLRNINESQRIPCRKQAGHIQTSIMRRGKAKKNK
jgi:hypothetical protein